MSAILRMTACLMPESNVLETRLCVMWNAKTHRIRIAVEVNRGLVFVAELLESIEFVATNATSNPIEAIPNVRNER